MPIVPSVPGSSLASLSTMLVRTLTTLHVEESEWV